MLGLGSVASIGKAALMWLAVVPSFTVAEYPPTRFPGRISEKIPIDNTMTVRYKELPDQICKSVFSSQKQITGYINIPADGNIPEQNIFFWYVQARVRTNALSLWLGGNPGESALNAFFSGHGPCNVIETSRETLETAANEWGWDRGSNLLFIDQPVGSGLSYDKINHGILNYMERSYTLSELNLEEKKVPNFIGYSGSFPSQNIPITHTKQAAHSTWRFLQGFYSAFPLEAPHGHDPIGLNIFAEGYGGKYAAVFSDYFNQRNTERHGKTIEALTTRLRTFPIKVISIGILNGCVDARVQMPYNFDQAQRNPYGIEMMHENDYLDIKKSLKDGDFNCDRKLAMCYERTKDLGYNDDVSAETQNMCFEALSICSDENQAWFSETGRALKDMTQVFPFSATSLNYLDYLNRPHVQQALGIPVNFTDINFDLNMGFFRSGDWSYGPIVPYLAQALNRGINIGLMYGDRDFFCNWLGGEALSLAIAKEAGGAYATKFPEAGYAPIHSNAKKIGGRVRQFGRLSFSRIFNAGHHIAAYQPETVFQVFARIIRSASVSTGQFINYETYATIGKSTADDKLPLPWQTSSKCYIRALKSTCSTATIAQILSGRGTIINNVWYQDENIWQPDFVRPHPYEATGTYTHPIILESNPV
ncbi:Carboxypeptidase S1 -like protein A [Ceratocystis fimbriata CBS 114723]|uniref:Carboxypeptidase S1-like protein A n=1 Tax=Ceratocystis fimbriata CBS 114723 TaxID=1035309 RepID=A0A2C5X335_9PEZI|nr:Carboxypeptidase S1 -like protein A [Ceratocystis fimbriata CBS 114723]